MTKIFVLCLSATFILAACGKDETPFEQINSFPGALDSIAIVGGDSGAVATPSNTSTIVWFDYDEQRRVKKMKTTFSNNYSFFEYEGQSPNPVVIIDSNLVPNGRSTILKTRFIYNNAGQVIKDTAFKSYTNEDGQQFPTNPIIKKHDYVYLPGQYTMVTNGLTNESWMDMDNNGNISSYYWRGAGHEFDTVRQYHNELNPFAQLNIKPVMIFNRGNPVLSTLFYPLKVDLFTSRDLFKSLKGHNTVMYRYDPSDITYIDCAYSKDARGKIDRMVWTNTSYSSITGQLNGRFHVNLKFYYNPG